VIIHVDECDVNFLVPFRQFCHSIPYSIYALLPALCWIKYSYISWRAVSFWANGSRRVVWRNHTAVWMFTWRLDGERSLTQLANGGGFDGLSERSLNDVVYDDDDDDYERSVDFEYEVCISVWNVNTSRIYVSSAVAPLAWCALDQTTWPLWTAKNCSRQS